MPTSCQPTLTGLDVLREWEIEREEGKEREEERMERRMELGGQRGEEGLGRVVK